MIRVLHILPSLNINAGMTNLVMNYYRKIDKDVVQFDFLSMYEVGVSCENEIENLGGKVYRPQKPELKLSAWKSINQFFKEHKNEIDIVHCHPIFAAGIYGYFANKNGIKTVIAHSHSNHYSEKKISSIRNKMLMPLVNRYATDYAACSKDAGKLFYGKNVRIIRNAIDCDRFKFSEVKRETIRKEFGLTDSTTVIGHVGRFSQEKNHNFMILVFFEYLKHNNNSILLLVGDGEGKNIIKKQIIELGIENKVVFTGMRSDVDGMLCAMDFFIFPSLFEGFGMSLLEAEASGLPCIVSDRIVDEVIISDRVIVIPGFNIESWSEALLTEVVVSNRKEYSELIRDKGFDINDEAKKLASYYEELAK